MVILMTSLFTVYAYMLPYKEMLVNIVELFFQLSLLMFLLLRSTQSIVDNFLIMNIVMMYTCNKYVTK